MGFWFGSWIQQAFSSHSASRHSAGTQQALSRHSAGIQQALSKHSAGTQQALSRHSAGTQQAFSKHSAGTQQALSKHSASTQQALSKHSAVIWDSKPLGHSTVPNNQSFIICQASFYHARLSHKFKVRLSNNYLYIQTNSYLGEACMLPPLPVDGVRLSFTILSSGMHPVILYQ